MNGGNGGNGGDGTGGAAGLGKSKQLVFETKYMYKSYYEKARVDNAFYL